MKIGIFDSGLGGLLVASKLMQALPEYDYVYLGDTKRVPYGSRSQETVYQFTKEAVEYLFSQDCQIIILACNTASAEALRTLQQDYLPAHFPERRILGVIIPTAEVVVEGGARKVGVLATQSTVHSGTFVRELQRLNPQLEIQQQAAPLLVPLIENNGLKWARPILQEYLQPLLEFGCDTLVLGCTHYSRLAEMVRELVGPQVTVAVQDELIPKKFSDYLERHPEIEGLLSKENQRHYLVTDLMENMAGIETVLIGQAVDIKLIEF